jgi:predicted transcriptional regulator
MVSLATTICALSEEKAIALFKAIAFSENDYSNMLITKLRLTRRQYYSIMKKLMDADLIRRISDKHSLTSLDKIILTMLEKLKQRLNTIGIL